MGQSVEDGPRDKAGGQVNLAKAPAPSFGRWLPECASSIFSISCDFFPLLYTTQTQLFHTALSASEHHSELVKHHLLQTSCLACKILLEGTS